MSRLLVTRELFDAFMLHFQVLPQFWEYVLLFGAKIRENEMSPPQLRFRKLAVDETELRTRCSVGFGTGIHHTMYGLRYAELNKRGGNRPWSIRQTAIYHQYTAVDKSSSWVMIAPSERIQSSLDLYVGSCTDLAALNPFEIHVLIVDSALANWRSYIIALTEQITHQVRRAVCRQLKLQLLISCSRTEYLLPQPTGKIHFSLSMYSSMPSSSASFVGALELRRS